MAIVAAYLMYSRQLDTDAAIVLIKQSRPGVEYALSAKRSMTNSDYRLMTVQTLAS